MTTRQMLSHFKLAAKHPYAVINYMLREGRMYHLLNTDRDMVKSLYGELFDSEELWREMDSGIKFMENPMDLRRSRQVELYVICRLTKPETIIETGVHHGISTTFILQAIKDNGFGRLYSIDLPNIGETTLPPGKETGWLVPEQLKNAWELIIGRSAELLPKVLTKIDHVDVFLHDSEHTYETMITEYTLAWPHIREGGLLLSDDTGRNKAFIHFCHKVQRSASWTKKGYGLIKK